MGLRIFLTGMFLVPALIVSSIPMFIPGLPVQYDSFAGSSIIPFGHRSYLYLGIEPYIIASILIQLIFSIPGMRKKAPEDCTRDSFTLSATLVITVFLGLLTAVIMSDRAHRFSILVLMSPFDLKWHISLAIYLTAGTALLVAAAFGITKWGVGNGVAVVMVFHYFLDSMKQLKPGELVPDSARGAVEICVGILCYASLVLFTLNILNARWKGKFNDEDKTDMRIFSMGLIPVYLTLSCLVVPSIIRLVYNHGSIGVTRYSWFSPASSVHIIATSIVIIAFTLLLFPYAKFKVKNSTDKTTAALVLPWIIIFLAGSYVVSVLLSSNPGFKLSPFFRLSSFILLPATLVQVAEEVKIRRKIRKSGVKWVHAAECQTMSEAKNLELELKLKGIDALILNKTCSPAFGAINLYDHSPQPLFAPDIRLGSGGLFLLVKESDKGERSIVKSREPI